LQGLCLLSGRAKAACGEEWAVEVSTVIQETQSRERRAEQRNGGVPRNACFPRCCPPVLLDMILARVPHLTEIILHCTLLSRIAMPRY
jgi:hypothetical protein